MSYQPNPNAILSLYQKLGPFTSAASLQAASLALTSALRNSMTETALYNLPLEQCVPVDTPVDALPVVVHPHNIAAALVGVSASAGAFGASLPIDPALQVYSTSAGAWQVLAQQASAFPTVQPQVEVPPPVAAPPPAPAPAPAPVAIAPAPAAPPAAPQPAAAPAQDIAALVEQAMGTPITAPQIDAESLAAPPAVPANPRPITTPEEFAAYRASQGYGAPAVIDHATQQPIQQLTPEQIKGPELQQPLPPLPGNPEAALQHAANGGLAGLAASAAPQGSQERHVGVSPAIGAPYGTTAQGAPGPAVVTHQQALAEAQSAPPSLVGLPDPSVAAPRLGPTGKQQASPFTRKVELRNKIASHPWWWEFMLHSASKVFNSVPAQALDASSTGSGPVQAYAGLVELLLVALDGADGDLTVAQLRSWLREVQTGYSGLADGPAINQLADHLFRSTK